MNPSELSKEVAESLAKEMPIEKVMEERDKTEDPEIRKEIDKVIEERKIPCENCGEEKFSSDDGFICPFCEDLV